ncbi:MAG: leucine-rich repeat protein [Saccharofermentanales bacterium]
MKKKLYLRIRAFVLVLLLISTTLIISPEQALADTQVAAGEEVTQIAADEETPQVAADEETSQTTVNEEVTEVISNSENQNDSEQPVNEEEPETVPDITDELQEMPDEQATETEQDTNETVADVSDDPDADVAVPDSAEHGKGTRDYIPPDDFVFIPETGTIRGYKGASKDVDIPSHIDGIEVKHIGEYAFKNEQLTSVTIPDSVITIGLIAFGQNQLENITIPDSVRQIDNSAFSYNKLSSVEIPDSVMSIGAFAFDSNELKSVIIPDSVSTIGESAFSNNSISHVSIPEHIIFIVDSAGNRLVFHPTIDQIGEKCFDYGVSLIGKHYIKANSNIRETPNGKVITRLWRPVFVTGTGTVQSEWLQFTFNGRTAYVAKVVTTNKSPPMTGYAKGNLNMRDVPGGSIIGTIPIGHKVQGKLVGNTVETTYNGKTGYVYASLLQKDPVQVTRYVKAGSNIRSTLAGTIIETLKMPILVTGTITGSYLRFTYKGQTVYVAMSLTTTQNPPITGYAKSAVNVRNAPGGSIIGTLPVGRQVKGVLAGNMVRFTYSSQTGYVYVSMLQATPVRVTRYVVANSIIRSAPGGSIIARPWRPLLASGTIQGAWLKFTYNGKTAYVAMSSTTTQNPPITGYTKSTVNVRSTPNGSVIGSLPANRKVSGVLVGNWVKFTYAGRTGYISASLLKK